MPESIRKTARALNINTDAKYRFERGIDPNSVLDGLKIASNLITRICGGEISTFVVSAKLHKKQVNKILYRKI